MAIESSQGFLPETKVGVSILDRYAHNISPIITHYLLDLDLLRGDGGRLMIAR